MRLSLVPLALLVALTACGQEEPEIEATNASVEDVARQVREASADEQFIRPGKWVSQVRFEEMTAPGVPENVAREMNQMLQQSQTFESCLTEEQAKRPREDFFTGSDSQCRYENFTMGDGRIDATMRCSQGDATQVTQMTGSYAPDSYQLQMASTVEGVAGASAGDMSLKMRIDAKRVGECTPADNQEGGNP